MKTTILQILKTLLNTEGVIYTDEQLRSAAAWALGKPNLQLSELQPTILQPILETINRQNHPSKYRFAPQKLTLDKTFFPTENAPNTEGVSQQLLALEKAGINWTNLEIYGACIACSPQFPDVPLFDFVKMTAAIAYCKSKNQSLQLVCGSVSGIQGYLYDIISRQAAKNLKGRSFYIQMLCDAVLEQVKQVLGLPKADYCTVYASGGGFYLLVPNSGNTEGVIATLQNNINQTLLEEHGLTLSVELFVSQPFDETQDFKTIWSTVFNEGNKLKRRRFSTQLANNFNAFFDEEQGELGGLQPRDAITNEEFSKHENPKQYQDKVFGLEVKKTTWQQVELGRDLKDANYWVMSTAGKIDDKLYNWKIYNQLAKTGSNTEGVIFSKRLNTIIDNEPFTFYGGNKFPSKTENGKESPKYFDELAQGDALDRLGVLRMDVDNLGSIIQNGLDKSKACFSRLSATSRHLDYFFKGYLNTIWRSKPNYQEFSYILYSGGDDLFIVGRWDVVLDFALAIQKEFKAWTCKNPELSISGGMAIIPSKFPIVQGAKLAEDAEKAAKNHTFTEGVVEKKKNAFAFANVPIYWHRPTNGEVPQSFFAPLNWDEEMPLVEALRDKLSDLLNNKRTITKSLLGKIATYADMQSRQTNIKDKGRWTWMMAYDLSRYRDTIKNKDVDTINFLNLIIANAFTSTNNGKQVGNNYTYLQLLALAARWVELEYRTHHE